MASGSEGVRASAGAHPASDRPGYGYEALSGGSDGSDVEPDHPQYTAFEVETSGGGESCEAPSSRASAKVNFPPELEAALQQRRAAAAAAAARRPRSMSAWSDVSRSSIRFEERYAINIQSDCLDFLIFNSHQAIEAK